MIDIVSRSGKRIGRISDSLDKDDTLVIDGVEVKLSDVYSNVSVKDSFNKAVSSLKDVVSGQGTDS
ncbi:MAG: hypothetical protein M0R17_02760 [Candidatus Omnitrophica bacterium]|jgi:hypothetical protein|nr:hypothetical protein [Candidatus Omnitrophota bacterium]